MPLSFKFFSLRRFCSMYSEAEIVIITKYNLLSQLQNEKHTEWHIKITSQVFTVCLGQMSITSQVSAVLLG